MRQSWIETANDAEVPPPEVDQQILASTRMNRSTAAVNAAVTESPSPLPPPVPEPSVGEFLAAKLARISKLATPPETPKAVGSRTQASTEA